jgi:Ca-activated chloride channel family protein
MVVVSATVTDRDNHPVTGLESGQFQLWEDKVEQQIEFFSEEQVPLSVGIIFDVSGSMADKIVAARNAAVLFFKMGSPSDEYFLIEFGEKPKLAQDWTTDISKLQNRLIFTVPEGRTALYDAVYLGLEKLQTAHNARKALLLISDGGDNHSRYKATDVQAFVREQDVQVYAIGLEDEDVYSYIYDSLDPVSRAWLPAPTYLPANPGHEVIQGLTDPTGGRAFFIKSTDTLEEVCTSIARQLKMEYVIGYRSSNPSKDGKWRKIRVKVTPPKTLRNVEVRSRSGYYADSGTGDVQAK